MRRNGHDLPFTLGVFTADDPKRSGIAEVDKRGVVLGFEEKPEQPKSNLAAAGVYIADSRIFDNFPHEQFEEIAHTFLEGVRK